MTQIRQKRASVENRPNAIADHQITTLRQEASIMSGYSSWRPIYRAMCPEPGPRDLFLVVLVNGRRVAIRSATEYERCKDAAEQTARDYQCQVKVLPMANAEMMTFLNLWPDPNEPLKPIEDLDPEFRAQAVQNCIDVLRECQEPRERAEALELLGHLGVNLQ